MGASTNRRADLFSIVLLWCLAAAAAGVAVPLSGDQAAATGIGTLGLLVVVALIVQVLVGRADGYLRRVSWSVVGTAVIVGAITAITVASTSLG